MARSAEPLDRDAVRESLRQLAANFDAGFLGAGSDERALRTAVEEGCRMATFLLQSTDGAAPAIRGRKFHPRPTSGRRPSDRDDFRIDWGGYEWTKSAGFTLSGLARMEVFFSGDHEGRPGFFAAWTPRYTRDAPGSVRPIELLLFMAWPDLAFVWREIAGSC